MKVLHIITGLETGGAEMMLVKLVTAHKRIGIDSHVINLKAPGTLQARIEKLGIPVQCLHFSFLTFPFRLLQLADLIRKIQPDSIHTWMYHANIVGVIARKLSGKRIPLFWGIRYALHNLRENKMSTRLLIRFGGIFASSPAAIIYNSSVSQMHHQKIGYQHPHSVIIPNGIDLDLWKPTTKARSEWRERLGIPNEAHLIGLVGRFDPEKDPQNFIKAANILLTENSQPHFVLVGPGYTEKNKQLQEWIRTSKLKNHFHLLGPQEDIPHLTAALDISTCASKSEAFPNIILEAMACGIATVVTDVGDSSRVVGEAGHVIQSGDPKAMALAWKDLLSDRNRRKEMGSKGRERAQNHYAIQNIARQYENLYKTIH